MSLDGLVLWDSLTNASATAGVGTSVVDCTMLDCVGAPVRVLLLFLQVDLLGKWQV